MYAVKRNGNGQTICAGCLARGMNATHWDSMLMTLHYDGGTVIGNYCSNCLTQIRLNYKVEIGKHETSVSDT